MSRNSKVARTYHEFNADIKQLNKLVKKLRSYSSAIDVLSTIDHVENGIKFIDNRVNDDIADEARS